VVFYKYLVNSRLMFYKQLTFEILIFGAVKIVFIVFFEKFPVTSVTRAYLLEDKRGGLIVYIIQCPR